MGQSEIDTTVRLRAARVHSTTEPRDFVSLEVTDEKSGITFLAVELTMEQFGRFVTGQESMAGLQPKFRGMDRLGKTHEHKTVGIVFAKADAPLLWGEDFIRAVRARVGEFEVDGWAASDYDLKGFNGHRLKKNDNGTQTYSVGFDRFVD